MLPDGAMEDLVDEFDNMRVEVPSAPTATRLYAHLAGCFHRVM